ncbi:MAG: hypothetical protein AAGD34_19765 [Pseudomonadota bacterium]
MRSAAHGPFYPDREFGTLFGFTRKEIQALVDQWPDIDDSDEETYAAISNAMNNLIIYPIDNPHLWSDYISVSQSDVARIFSLWRGRVPTDPLDGMF